MRKILLPAALTCLLLVGVAVYLQKKESPTDTSPPSGTEVGTESELRAHYDALVSALYQELAGTKEDAYITHETLLSRIEALEMALESLGGSLPSLDDMGDAPGDASGDTVTHSASPDTEAEEKTAPLFAYTVEDGCATITAYNPQAGDPQDIALPATLGGYPVTRIGDSAFSGTTVRCVTVPEGVTDIGWFAFAGCSDLQSVSLPASLSHIDYGAFDACPNVVLTCPRDSYAARYAASFGLPRQET